ncbi:LysR family transcriptional regulator [Nocardia testacea]|uniref:LysR family transcriptional regulator n=1 Tax=Nocardia testacea TaxID=248551 RepID=UPI0033CC19BE
MDTRLLEYFVSVADELNVTRAAARLFAAQSTVSAGLNSLERDLGVKLFARTTKTVSLLPAGENLLEEARQILDAVERLRAHAAESTQGIRGTVRIGTFVAMPTFALPRVLARFRDEYPSVDVRLAASFAGSTGLAEDLLRGRLDVAFLALPAPTELDAWELGRYEFVALVPPQHPLAKRRSISLAELAAERWVDVLPGYGNRVRLERSLVERGIVRKLGTEVAELSSVAPYVAAGFGIAVVPDIIDPDGSVRLPLDDPPEPWVLFLASRRGATRQPHIHALVEHLRSHAEAADFLVPHVAEQSR